MSSSEGLPAYGIGDSVISRTSLVTIPVLPGEVRVEIPTASRGTVTAQRPDDRVHPYTVAFEVGEGGVVEIDVSNEEIVPVSPHDPVRPVPVVRLEDMPPLVARRPRRPLPYEPTLQYPHRHCAHMHSMIAFMIVSAYILVLTMEPLTMLTFTVLVIGVVYGYELSRYGHLSWVPTAFRFAEPAEHEKLVVDPRWAKYAVASDRALNLTLVALLMYQLLYMLDDDKASMTGYVVHLAAVAIATALKIYTHDRAASIHPK